MGQATRLSVTATQKSGAAVRASAEAAPTGHRREHTGQIAILAFDHRGSLSSLLEPEVLARTGGVDQALRQAKALIMEAAVEAAPKVAEVARPGVLVDELHGGELIGAAKRSGLLLAMPAERSASPETELELEFGTDFGAHIERCDPDLVKVLVFFDPERPAAVTEREVLTLRALSDWLVSSGRELLLEVQVPPSERLLARVGGSRERFESELRFEATMQAIRTFRAAGVSVAWWKLEGVVDRGQALALSELARSGSDPAHGCLLLGRNAPAELLRRWLEVAAGTPGWDGFAIGRSIWLSPVRDQLTGASDRRSAIAAIGSEWVRLARTWAELKSA
ncbi:MAG TPA: DUF2090 domain-containing protein [Solirubrobacteraceae bacterium]|nr:DUF2090 domain-containing protein [Solirubrobacteraceae bacterium]